MTIVQFEGSKWGQNKTTVNFSLVFYLNVHYFLKLTLISIMLNIIFYEIKCAVK